MNGLTPGTDLPTDLPETDLPVAELPRNAGDFISDTHEKELVEGPAIRLIRRDTGLDKAQVAKFFQEAPENRGDIATHTGSYAGRMAYALTAVNPTIGEQIAQTIEARIIEVGALTPDDIEAARVEVLNAEMPGWQDLTLPQ